MRAHSADRGSSKQVHTRDRLLHGDCVTLLRCVEPHSVDLVCTDPPYGIGFRGQDWDTFRRPYGAPGTKPGSAYDFRNWLGGIATELSRVMKPGAFAFLCMGARQDSIASTIDALANAGFKTDFTSLYWTYASGFPKTMNIGKAVDKRAGAERPVVGSRKQHDIRNGGYGSSRREFVEPVRGGPVTREAKHLDGAYAGFQPKPAVETVIVAMKPLSERSYVDQALSNRKGVTWLDNCRIPTMDRISIHDAPKGTFAGGPANRGSATNYRYNSAGRFPANVVVSDNALGDHSRFFSLDAWSAARVPFLVVAKAAKREKIAGRDGNPHPTVKPLKLMQYLITLGSRPGDVVLDPFLGSGTTAVAARLLDRRYIGIEREPRYFQMAQARLRAAAR